MDAVKLRREHCPAQWGKTLQLPRPMRNRKRKNRKSTMRVPDCTFNRLLIIRLQHEPLLLRLIILLDLDYFLPWFSAASNNLSGGQITRPNRHSAPLSRGQTRRRG